MVGIQRVRAFYQRTPLWIQRRRLNGEYPTAELLFNLNRLFGIILWLYENMMTKTIFDQWNQSESIQSDINRMHINPNLSNGCLMTIIHFWKWFCLFKSLCFLILEWSCCHLPTLGTFGLSNESSVMTSC